MRVCETDTCTGEEGHGGMGMEGGTFGMERWEVGVEAVAVAEKETEKDSVSSLTENKERQKLAKVSFGVKNSNLGES
jgi:hypothetical protein